MVPSLLHQLSSLHSAAEGAKHGVTGSLALSIMKSLLTWLIEVPLRKIIPLSLETIILQLHGILGGCFTPVRVAWLELWATN